MFGPVIMTAPHVWKKLGPLAYAWRERDPSNPRWADLEYLVFDSLNKPPFNAIATAPHSERAFSSITPSRIGGLKLRARFRGSLRRREALR